jgi:hypothetical protein
MRCQIRKKNDIQFNLPCILLFVHGHRRVEYLLFLVMNTHFKQVSLHRGGREYRVNPSRFFYVKSMGWFVYTRGHFVLNHGLISQDGIAGPFLSKQTANNFVVKMFADSF